MPSPTRRLSAASTVILRCMAAAGLCAAAGWGLAAEPPPLPLVERDGAAWIIMDGRVGAAIDREVTVEWRAPWLVLRVDDRAFRTAVGWRLASVTGGMPGLCWLSDPVRVDLGRPALTPTALAAALTALGVPRRWDRDRRALIVPPARPGDADPPGPVAPASGASGPAAPAAGATPVDDRSGGPRAVPPPSRPAPAPDAPRAVAGVPPSAPSGRDRTPVVVVDAGHGGHDCGARGKTGLFEKTVTLDISRRLAALLRDRGVTVVMTRETDRYVSLEDRVAITRRAQADLFVSVHVNASPNRTAHGIETYVYGARAMGRSAEAVVRRENADANYMDIALGDLEQQAHHEASIRMAGRIENAIVEQLKTVGRKKRRVEAAPFYVLARSGRPAVLIEVGFISHREEERRLGDPAYRRRIAESIAAGLEVSGGAAAQRPRTAPGGSSGG